MNLQESIRRILREEINKKFPKPSVSLDKTVFMWLDLYFKDSEIYEHEYWKDHGFQFEFCKDGREIADLRVVFDDRSPNFGPRDKRPTSERSVKEVMLYIYPIMINQLLNDISIRKNYLLYLIEEWFEDTKLDKIQQGFNRNDLSLDYVTVFESKKRGDICVPPVQKPEDTSTQEMMDYIKKNTLFSYKDMEEHEEDEPGWIEKTYLEKLRGKEKERVSQEDKENNMNLQENISRIREMMNLNEKLEDIQGTPLYHKTSTSRGLDIINSDSLRGTLPSGDYLGLDTRLANTKTQTAISFTRDKNWQPNNTIGIGLDSPLEDTGITFVVDKDKLKTKYKVEPFNYHGIDPDSEYKEKFNELEERVMTNEIYPLHKYVIDIIYTGDNPEVQQIIDNYLNR